MADVLQDKMTRFPKIARAGLCLPILLASSALIEAGGIERIAVTDTAITIHPEAGTSGMLKVVPVEPYDTYQSSRGWALGNTSDGGLVDFNREGSALLTFTTPSTAFDPQISNTTGLIEASKVSQLAIRVKVDNFTGTLPATAFVFNGGGVASAGFSITADGTWQIARLDLSTVTGTTTWSGQPTLRLDLPDAASIAGYENAGISIDWIAVTNKPTFSDPLTWGRWDKFWDLGYQAAATTADASSPITISRFDGAIDRYYQKFLLVNGFSPVGDFHWVDDFSGLSYQTVTDHGFQPSGPGAGSGSIVDGVYRMTYADASPFDPQLVTSNQEINGTKTRYMHARVRMTGYTGAASSITAGMFSTASGVSQANTAFVPDGTWQILHFDMQTDPDWGGNENVRLDIPNNLSGASDFLSATLEVDWIAASNDPAYDGSGTLGGYEIKYDFTIDRLETRITPLTGRKGVDSYSPTDFAALGTNVGKLNVTVNNLVQNVASPRIRWKHDGLTFGINPDRLNSTLDQISILGALGINTYCTMLNQSNAALANDQNWPFINIRSSDQAPNNLFAFNTGDAYGLRYTRAVFEYMAHRMTQPGVTPCDNWIYGNEVDAHWFWHNLGLVPAADFREYFAIEFRQAALVLAKYHPQFRALLSHTHHWLSQAGNVNQGMPSKDLIDGLNTKWSAEGNFAWDLASHPYPQNLFTPSFWNDTQATLDFNTTKVTYKNYEVLPEYFQRDELRFNGRQRGISLTEQGFHTPNAGADQNLQAAAYAYHWHRFKRIPGLKADILHRFADHPDEGGLLLGIRDLGNTPKESYQALAAADTPNWRTTFDNYLPLLPFSSWDDVASVPAWTTLDLPFDEAGFTGGWQPLKNIGGFTTNADGNLTGTATGSDPSISNDNFFALERDSERILVRMKVNSGSRGEIYWGTQSINSYQSVRKFTWITNPDNAFHTYDIDTLDHPEWNGQIIRRLRLDPTNVSSGDFELDYILTGKRDDFDQDGISDIDEGISSETDTDGDHIPDFADTDSDNDGIPDSAEALLALAWDPAKTGSAATGGDGTWDVSHNLWWNGATRVAWPAVSSHKDQANFGGAPGTVTLAPGGVTAAVMTFETGGYTLVGGPLTLDGAATLRSPGGTTTFAVSITGETPVTIDSGTVVFANPANTYSGDTIVNTAILVVTGNSIPDSGNLVVHPGGKVAANANETVRQLLLGDILQVAGTWGSTSSSATHKNDTWFSGTGTITVLEGAANPYGTWIDAFTSLTDPDDRLPGADPDGDRLSNLGEFAFGGNPSSASDKGPAHSEVANDRLVHTIAVRNGASALFAGSGSPLTASFDGVDYTIAGSKDLTSFLDTVNKRASVVIGPLDPSPPAGYEYVTFELNDAVSIYPKGFLRSTATESP